MLAVRSYVAIILFFATSVYAGSKVIEGKVPGSKLTVKFTYQQTANYIVLTPESENQICEKPRADQLAQETVALPANDPVIKMNKKIIEGKGNCLVSIRVKQSQLDDAIVYLNDLDVPTSASNTMIGMLHACRQDLKLGNI